MFRRHGPRRPAVNERTRYQMERLFPLRRRKRHKFARAADVVRPHRIVAKDIVDLRAVVHDGIALFAETLPLAAGQSEPRQAQVAAYEANTREELLLNFVRPQFRTAQTFDDAGAAVGRIGGAHQHLDSAARSLQQAAQQEGAEKPSGAPSSGWTRDCPALLLRDRLEGATRHRRASVRVPACRPPVGVS